MKQELITCQSFDESTGSETQTVPLTQSRMTYKRNIDSVNLTESLREKKKPERKLIATRTYFVLSLKNWKPDDSRIKFLKCLQKIPFN